MDELSLSHSIRSFFGDLLRRGSGRSQSGASSGSGSQSLSPRRSRSFRRSRKTAVLPLDQTWNDFLDVYAGESRNLSNCARPLCFSGYGHMVPPEPRHEHARRRALESAGLNDHRIWRKLRPWLDAQLRSLLAQWSIGMCSVSTIEETEQVVHYDIGLDRDLRHIARHLSLDGHAILSRDWFGLLDAAADWRTQLNPLVHGPPFIKFYLGVPVLIRGYAVGVIAVFDPYLRNRIAPELVAELQQIASRLTTKLAEDRKTSPRPRVDLGSPSLCNRSNSTLNDTPETPSSSPSLHSATELCLTSLGPGISSALRPAACVVVQPYEILETLLRCRSISHAISKACRIVSTMLGLEIAYVAEVRHVPDRLRMRLVAKYSSDSDLEAELDVLVNAHDVDCDNAFNCSLHARAIQSEYGVSFAAGSTSRCALKSGVLMPFRRTVNRNGGFLMGAFSPRRREISPGDLAFMKKAVKALENILSCQEEAGEVAGVFKSTLVN